ncbi:MAG: hypothetical protein ACFFBD_10800 [Candidatus Hodarchaeota archaeon]
MTEKDDVDVEQFMELFKNAKKIELQGVTFQGDVEIILEDDEDTK